MSYVVRVLKLDSEGQRRRKANPKIHVATPLFFGFAYIMLGTVPTREARGAGWVGGDC